MSETKQINRPKFVTFIGYFYIIGSILILFTIFVDQETPINVRFDLANIPNSIVVPIISAVSLVMAYGYLKMARFGYYLAIFYSIIFMCISFKLVTNIGGQPFIGNAIWSIIVLIYTIIIRKKFVN